MNKEELFLNLNKGILEERYRIFNINLEKNLIYIQRFGGLINVVSEFKDKHVIVAGAGFSISQHDFDLLKKYQDREEIIILAADMALLPLLKRGIRPKYVISCETTPVNYFCGMDTEEMHLLAFSCISHTNLRKWLGNISFYNWMIHGELYDRLWERAGSDLGFVATGSIVTTQAVSFALGCGIRSLMLIGNDMGFGSEYYVNETVVYRKNLNLTDRIISLDSIEMNISKKKREFEVHRNGRLFYTNNQFLAAKLWLEDLFKQINIPIYESNDMGCSAESVIKMSLNDYLEYFNKRRVRRK
jgi:hypothetical protein